MGWRRVSSSSRHPAAGCCRRLGAAGTSPDDPCFQASLARFREEKPGEWSALVQKIATATAAPKPKEAEPAKS